MWQEDLARLATSLQCPLCSQPFANAYTLGECGHVFCRDCIVGHLRREEKDCRCPQCGLPMLVRNLKRMLALNVIVACVQKLETMDVDMDMDMDVDADADVDARKPAPPVAATISPLERKKARLSLSGPRMVILSTGLSADERAILASSHQSIDPKVAVVLSSRFGDAVTHIVTGTNADGRCARTLKYLQGLLAHKWILRFGWILASLSARRWLPEDDHWVAGDTTSTECTDIPRTYHGARGLLFGGREFWLAGRFEAGPSRAELLACIRLGGGRLAKHRTSDVIVITDSPNSPNSPDSPDSPNSPDRGGSHHYGWLLDCISTHCVPPD